MSARGTEKNASLTVLSYRKSLQGWGRHIGKEHKNVWKHEKQYHTAIIPTNVKNGEIQLPKI